jgi:hypothetical protein
MAKLTAWVVTLIGIFLLLPLVGIVPVESLLGGLLHWLIAIAVLVVGIGKLVRNYGAAPKKKA